MMMPGWKVEQTQNAIGYWFLSLFLVVQLHKLKWKLKWCYSAAKLTAKDAIHIAAIWCDFKSWNKEKTKLYIWSSDQMSIDEIQINSSLKIHPKLVFDDHERRFRQLHQGSASKLVCWLIKTCGDFFLSSREKMKMKCLGGAREIIKRY